MKILVTGGAGFIGSHVSRLLADMSYTVVIVDNFSTGRRENLPNHELLKDYLGQDILENDGLLRCFSEERPDIVVHLAAQPAISTSIKNPWIDFDINVRGTMNVISACRDFQVKRMIFASTSAVYGIETLCFEGSPLNPDTPYGISKLAAEMYIRHLLPASTILRFGNVYGPRQVPLGENQLIARIIRHFEYGDEFYIHGDGEQTRDFVYVGDVARAVERALHGPPGTFNIATGKSHSVNNVAEIFEHLYDVRGYKWQYDGKPQDRTSVEMLVRRAEDLLGWKAEMPLHRGINLTLDWWKSLDKSPHKS